MVVHGWSALHRTGLVVAWALWACSACGGSVSGGQGAGAKGGAAAEKDAGAAGSTSGSSAAGTTSGRGGAGGAGTGATGARGGRGGMSGTDTPAGMGGTQATGAGGNMNGMAATSGSAGRAGAGSGGSGSGASGTSKLPLPPGAADKPKPSGASADLRVLPWAGFKAAVSYTFDDSQPSHVAHLAKIKATGARVTWYLNSSNNWVGGYDAAFKDALAAGHELGNHTVHHCNADLSGCDNALGSVDAEIDDCSKYIEDTLGGPPVLSMAYPFGDGGYAGKARERFLLARGTGGGMVTFTGNTDPFNLPTFAAQGGEAASVFNGAIDGARGAGAWVNFLFHSLLPTDQNWYAGVEIANVTASIEHAQQLEDVWIDTIANVGAYWLGAKALSAANASNVGGGMSWSWTLPAHFPEGQFVRVTVAGGELRQDGEALPWDGHGYYEVALDAKELAWSP